MGIKITAYHYNTMCDTYGCAGMARVSLSMDDTPGSLKHNICNECLEGIVAEAPLHMVLVREDVYEYIHAEIAKAIAWTIHQDRCHNSGCVPDGDNSDLPVVDMDMAELNKGIIPKDKAVSLLSDDDATLPTDTTWGPSIIAKLIDTDTGKMLMQKAKDLSLPSEALLEDFKSEHIEADVSDQAETALIKSYNWQDLKKLARDLKIENCNTMKRDVLEAEILKRL